METKQFMNILLLVLIPLAHSCSSSSSPKGLLNQDSLATFLNDTAEKIVRGGLGKQDAYAKAIVLLDRALALKPDFTVAYENKANYLLKLGKCGEAAELMDTILRYKKNDPITLTKKGFILQKCFGNKRDEALKYLDQAAAIFYESYKTKNNLSDFKTKNNLSDFKNYVLNMLFLHGRDSTLTILDKEKDNWIRKEPSENNFKIFRDYIAKINVNDYLH